MSLQNNLDNIENGFTQESVNNTVVPQPGIDPAPTGPPVYLPPQSSANLPTTPPKKPRLPRLVTVLSILFWGPTLLMAVFIGYLMFQQSQGVSGTEYIGLMVAPFMLLEFVLGIVYLVVLIIYIFSKYPTLKKRIASIVVVLFLLLGYGFMIIGDLIDYSKKNDAKKPISDSEMISLIDNCKVTSVTKEGDKVTFMYTNEVFFNQQDDKYIWDRTNANAASFDSFVSEVKKMKGKCNQFIIATDDEIDPTISYINSNQAKELLTQCEIANFNWSKEGLKYAPKPASGTETNIILEKYQSFSHLFLTENEASILWPTYLESKKHCPDLR